MTKPESGEQPIPSGATPRDAAVPDDSKASVSSADEGARLGARFDQPTMISKGQPAPVFRAEDTPAPFEMSRALEGERLDHFEIKEFVGGGGMGAVFRAVDTTLDRTVAIKVLSRDHADDEETVRRFRFEARSAARCDHENIARVFYVGKDQGLEYIAMEFVDGRNLRDLVVQSGPLPLVDCINYTLQIAEAVSHASGRDVIHRDIKPSNILVTTDGQAKLVDMGLARLHKVDRSSEDLTASGVTLGTFDYISPEQARDPRNADVRSDIYSLGCTLYYMLTARPPFPDGTVLQKLLQHQGDTPPDPRETNFDVPPEVSRIVLKMLAKDPEKRYQKPSELVGDLLILASELGIRTPNGGVVWVGAPRNQPSILERVLPVLVPAVSLVVIVAALFAMSASNESSVSLLPATDSPGVRAESSPESAAPVAASGDQRTAADVSRDEAATGPPINASDAPGAATSSGAVEAPAEENPETPSEPEPSDNEKRLAVAAIASAAIDTPTSTSGATVVEVGSGELAAGISAEDSRTDVTAPNVSVPPAPQAGYLYVSDESGQTNHFATLRSACAVARTGDVIVLRYDGPREERPFELTKVDLTIRAAAGFRPVIHFRPAESDRQPRSMITVKGGTLMMVDVSVELDLVKDLPPTDSWSLFESRLAKALHLDGCSLTVRNASEKGHALHKGVAFFDVKSPQGGEALLMLDDTAIDRTVRIELDDCIARGEAVFLRSNDLQAVELVWDNGLLATTEQLFFAEGAGVRSKYNGKTRIVLRHLTAEVRGALCRLQNNQQTPFQLHTEIDCTNSIFLTGPSSTEPEFALIEQEGVDSDSESQARVKFTDVKNFYDGFSSVRIFRRLEVDEMMPRTPLPVWQSFWTGGQQKLRVAWARRPDSALPVNGYAPRDYVLDEDKAYNPTIGGATDGRDAGFIRDDLPDPLPPSADSLSNGGGN